MNQYVWFEAPPCKGFNIHIKLTLYYDWIIQNTADAVYCQHPNWKEKEKEDENLNDQNPFGSSSQTTGLRALAILQICVVSMYHCSIKMLFIIMLNT